MSIIQVQPGTKFTIKATNTYVFGDEADKTVATYAFHIVDGGSFSGTIIPKIRSSAFQAQTGTVTLAPTGSGSTLDDVTFTACAYWNEATGLYSTASITAVPSLISVRASGWTVALDCTVLSTGTAVVYVSRIMGASA